MANKKQTKKNSQQAKLASKSSRPSTKQAPKKRGTLLSVLLVLILLHGIFASYLAFTLRKELYAESQSWVIPVLTLVSLATILGVIGMFLWKKWGIYLYSAACVVAAVVHLVLTGTGLAVLYDLIPVLFLGYIINLQSKQSLFEYQIILTHSAKPTCLLNV